ncbi:MAG: DUF2391 domain-containing protein [Halanaeroarchaeum sp.]
MAVEDDPPDSFVDVIEELHELEGMFSDPAAQEQVAEAKAAVRRASSGTVFGRIIHGFDRADLAEATVGSLLIGIPMFVEGGTKEIGVFLAGHPLAFVGTLVLAVGLTVAIIYVADIQDVRVKSPILGLVPRRLVGVLGAAAVTAIVLMTMWGRVDWAQPWLASCQIAVAFVPMAIGGALGDILPGS